MREQRLSVRVWDAPIRLFHWVVVALVFTSWFTQYQNWMSAHLIAGYTMFAALLFRFAWGVVGSDTARFRHFLKSPVAAFAHLRSVARREPDRDVGHNAAGGWMVLVLLALLTVQVGTGLCANNEVDVEGPFAELVGFKWSNWLTHVHAVTFTAIEVAVLLHVAAVLAYALLRGRNLVRPMITGSKLMPPGVRTPRMRSPVLALLLLAVAGGLVAFVVTWA